MKSRSQRLDELRQYESNRSIDEKVIDVIAAATNIKIDYSNAIKAAGTTDDCEKIYNYMIENM